MRKIVTFSLASVLLVGCGSKLNSQQKDRFYNSMITLGKVAKVSTLAVEENLYTAASMSHAKSMHPISRWFLSSDSLQTIMDAPNDFSLMREKIQTAKQKKLCQISSSGDKRLLDLKLNNSTLGNFSSSVTGSSCPIHGEVKINVTQADRSAGGDFTWKYRANTPDFAALSDIDESNLTGKIEVTSDSSTNNSEEKVNASMKTKFDGKAHSKKEGEINYFIESSLSASLSANKNSPTITNKELSLELKMGIRYPDFTAELRATGKDEDSLKYYLNSEEISKQEYEKYFSPSGINHQIKLKIN